MNKNTESSRMKINHNRYSTRFSLPNIKKEENDNIKQINLLNSSNVVEEWLDEFETYKHVQFSKNVTFVNKTNKPKKRYSFPINDTFNSNQEQQTNVLPNISTEKMNHQSKNFSILPPTITETTFYRSARNRSLSNSTVNSSRHSSFSLNPLVIHGNTPSIASSLLTSSINKIRLSSFEFNLSLSEIDREKLDDIRLRIPEEFENLIPTLIKLGVISFPKNFFQNNYQEQMTTKELIEYHRIILLMKKDQDNIEHQRYLEHLYGTILPFNDIHYQHHLLKPTLSFQGQLALIAACQDEIEQELNKKIKSWKTIPMKSFTTNYSEYSYSTNKSSLIGNSLRIRKKSIKTYSSIKSNAELSSIIDQNSLEIFVPDQIDNQWKRKSTIHIIEQGIILLDKVRSLPSPILSSIPSNQHTIYDINQINLVKEFKRWAFLWSTLYA